MDRHDVERIARRMASRPQVRRVAAELGGAGDVGTEPTGELAQSEVLGCDTTPGITFRCPTAANFDCPVAAEYAQYACNQPFVHLCGPGPEPYDCNSTAGVFMCMTFVCPAPGGPEFDCDETYDFICANQFKCYLPDFACQAGHLFQCGLWFGCGRRPEDDGGAQPGNFTCRAGGEVCPDQDTYGGCMEPGAPFAGCSPEAPFTNLDVTPGDFFCGLNKTPPENLAFDCYPTFTCESFDDFDCAQTFRCVGDGSEDARFVCRAIGGFTCWVVPGQEAFTCIGNRTFECPTSAFYCSDLANHYCADIPFGCARNHPAQYPCDAATFHCAPPASFTCLTVAKECSEAHAHTCPGRFTCPATGFECKHQFECTDAVHDCPAGFVCAWGTTGYVCPVPGDHACPAGYEGA